MINIYITRHGETDWNIHWKLQGRADIALNEKGKEQALLTGKGFCNKGIVFDKVYSSPLKRAVETAILISGKTEKEITKDERIIEFCFGKAEGKTPEERNNDPELKNFNLFFTDPEKYIALENAETFNSILKRTKDFWQNEIKNLEQNDDIKNILIVTHGGTMQSLLLHIDGRELKDFWKVNMPNCTINKIILQNGTYSLEWTGKVFYNSTEDISTGFIKNK